MAILITGAAGFIGFHVAEALLTRGEAVIGIDDLREYYDIRLKKARLARLITRRGFRFVRADIADKLALAVICKSNPNIDRIVHLAAQPGVRHSLSNPHSYVQSNIMGHLIVLEAARKLNNLQHMVYASTSSVYGTNVTLPFRENDRTDTPISLYAATKRADELMSYAYGHLFEVPQTALRFFTVYGPWGRPDMACYAFARDIVSGEAITLYDDGQLRRDFTYIDDIVAGVIGVLDQPPKSRIPPVSVLNIGNHRSERVQTLVTLLERSLGRRAIVQTVRRPPADVEETFAAVGKIGRLTGYIPRVILQEGIPQFVHWFKKWHG